MDVIFIKEYLSYEIDKVLKQVNKTTAERLISLGVCKELKPKKKQLKKQIKLETK